MRTGTNTGMVANGRRIMWQDSEETDVLLDAVRQGDTAAINRLLEHYRPALRRLIRARLDPKLRARIDASDVIQEVSIEVNRRLNDYLRDPRMPFGLWVRQLARDRMIDAHRRHRLAERRSIDREQVQAAAFTDSSVFDLAAQLEDPAVTPAAAAIRRELQRRFDAALLMLNEQEREILLMRHAEQMSNSEVAIALGLSQPAAGMRYMRAVRRLREVLSDR